MANGRNGVDAETAHNARTFSKDAANVGTATLRERLAATTRLQRVAGSAAAIAALLVVGVSCAMNRHRNKLLLSNSKGLKKLLE